MSVTHDWYPSDGERAFAERRERRERIATAVLAGLTGLLHRSDSVLGPSALRDQARHAVAWADALIAELDK